MYKHMLTKKHVGQCEDVKTGERVREGDKETCSETVKDIVVQRKK